MNRIIVFGLILAAFGAVFAPVFAQNANRKPQWINVPNQAVFTEQLLEFKVTAYDVDDDGLSYSATNMPSDATFNPETQVFSWHPGPFQAGTYRPVFRVFDGEDTADMTVIIVVNSRSNPPPFPPQPPPPFPPPGPPSPLPPPQPPPPTGPPIFVNFNPPLYAKEGQLYTYTVQAVGNNNNPVTYRIISGPQGLSINPGLGIILWLPNFDQGRPEPYNVTVGIANGQFEASRSFNIIVIDVPQVAPPVAPPAPRPPVQPPPPAEPVLEITDLKAEADEDGNFIISWKTNLAARSRVIYDTESQAEKKSDFTYENATLDPDPEVAANFKTEHLVKLEDLKRGTTYYFRAVSKTKNQIAVSDEMSFMTEGRQGLALLSALASLFKNPWLYIILILILIWILYRKFVSKNKS